MYKTHGFIQASIYVCFHLSLYLVYYLVLLKLFMVMKIVHWFMSCITQTVHGLCKLFSGFMYIMQRFSILYTVHGLCQLSIGLFFVLQK